MAEIFTGRLLYGAAIYPEVWDRDVMAADAAHMARLGMNTARLGEFIWSTIEPEPDKFELGLVHETLDILAAHGLSAIMCTPTVTPPIWLTHGHPERLHHTADGTPLGHGSRQHVCTNNPYFRERAAKITAVLAAEFGQDLRILAWQLDNEFKSHVDGCHCAVCHELWSSWLQSRYQEVADLNQRWSSAVWSETYQSFAQVPLPGPTPFLHNASLTTSFRAFSQAHINEFAASQARIIREHSELPITHNSGFGFFLDNDGMFSDLDFSSFDTYPSADNYPAFLMNLDYFQHFGATSNTMLMETSTSHGGSIAGYGRPHPRGFVEAEIFANFSSGSKGFLFWPFRQHRGGSEQPHGAVVSPWGAPTIGHEAAAAGGRLLQKITPLLENSESVHADVAITYSDRARAFLATETGGKLDYRGVLSDIHRRFVEAGIGRDLVPESAKLTGYKILFTPYAHHLSEEFLQRVRSWVLAGGTWVVGPGSGDRNADHGWHTDAALGALEDLAGVRGIFQFPATGSGTTGNAWDWRGELDGMSTFVETTTARALGTVSTGPAAGLAFLTEHSGTDTTGRGKVILLGSLPQGFDEPSLLDAVIKYVTAPLASSAQRSGGAGVVEYQRRKDGRLQRWLVNMSATAAELTLPVAATELLTNTELHAGTHRLKPYAYLIAEERKA